jgi:hypothetical protein
MPRRLISTGSKSEHEVGYYRVVVDQRMRIEIEVTARRSA